MRILGLSLAAVLALIVPVVGHADAPGSVAGPANAGPAAAIVLAWDGGGSSRHLGAVDAQPTAGRTHQWNDGGGRAHWGPNRYRYYGGWGPYGGPGVPNYYIWVPGSAIFDDPFPDWRGPTGGWGNP
jgi:hypothetical protein